MSALLQRFWTDHRLASVVSIALLFLGLLIKPWTLVLALAVAFGGPLLKRLDRLSSSSLATWRRSDWCGLALLLAAVLLALTGKSGGQGALILALLPVAWVLVTDRSILRGASAPESAERLTTQRLTGTATQPAAPVLRVSDSEAICQQLWLAFVNDENLVVSSYEDEDIDPLEGPEGYEADDDCPRIYLVCDGSNGNSAEIRLLQDQTFCDEDTELLGEADDFEGFQTLFSKFLRHGGRLEDCNAVLSACGSDGRTSPTSSDEAECPKEAVSGGSAPGVRLVGSELLAKLKELGDVGKSDIVRACGYVSTTQDGGERLNFTAFYEALLEAKGMDPSSRGSNSNENDDELPSSSTDLPADWQQLDGSEIVERLRETADLSGDVLAALAVSDDWEVRRAVAWHEDTPAPVLEALAEDDDSDVRQAIQERCLPQDWRVMSQDEKVAALQASDVSLEIINMLAGLENWSLRQAVAWSPSTPESVLARLKDDDDDDVIYAATAERQLPIEWRFLSRWDKVERLGGETVDIEILEILAKSRASDVRRAVALNAGTPEQLLAALIEDDDANVRSAVRERDLPDAWKSMDDHDRVSALREEEVPGSILAILARSGNWTVRQAVALSPATPCSILEILSRDEDADVQSAVRERDLPDDWKRLDEDEQVRRLKKGSVEPNVLTILAKSGRWVVREAVAKSPETPDDILAQLSDDDDSDVEMAAKKAMKKRQSQGLAGGNSWITGSLPFADLDKGFVIFASPLQVWDDESGLNEDAVESLKGHALKFITLVSECSGCWGSDYITDQSEKCSRPFFVIDPKGDCLFSLVSSSGGSEADKAVIYSSAEEAVHSPSVGRNGRIYACVAFVYDHDDSLIEFEDFNREESEDGDQFDNIPAIARAMGEDVEVYLRLPEADGDVDTVFYGSWDADGDLDEEEELGSELDRSLLEGVAYGSPFAGLSGQSEREVSDGDEEHSIYIKTEPGGRIAFCRLDSGLIRQLQESIATQELKADLEEEMRDNSYGAMNECDGVVNSGDEGDSGNEGTIVFSEDQSHLGPGLKGDGEAFEDGVYVVLMRLSKCSIAFEFTAKGGFDADEFEEISVPVRLPEEIAHGLYGHPDFNIITGFRFRGEPVEEYEGEVDDRGYDDQLTFFVVKDGETTVLYGNYNGEEEWCDEGQANALLSSFL